MICPQRRAYAAAQKGGTVHYVWIAAGSVTAMNASLDAGVRCAFGL